MQGPSALPSFVMPLQERAPTPGPDSTVSRALHLDADAQEERLKRTKKEELQSVAPRDDLKSILWNTRMSSKSRLTPGLGMGATRPAGSAHPTAIDEFYYFASLDPESFYQLHRANSRRNTCRYQVQRLSSCFAAIDRRGVAPRRVPKRKLNELRFGEINTPECKSEKRKRKRQRRCVVELRQ